MVTKKIIMTTQEVADRYSQLVKENNWSKIQDELFAADANSIEPEHAANMGLQSVQGMEAIKKKAEIFNSMVEEMHGGYCSEPAVGGNFFSVAMGMDVTMKGEKRSKMDEVVVYEVKDGKIASEQFFY